MLGNKFSGFLSWKKIVALEWRMLRWVGRAALALATIFYTLNSAPMAWVWGKTKWVRMQPISHLEVLLKDAKSRGDFANIEEWMSYRPRREAKDLISIATPYSAFFSPFVFFYFSESMDRIGDKDAADRWNMIAHFRLRFDLLRCGLDNGVEMGQKLFNVLAIAQPNYYRQIAEDRRRALALDVLAFDDRYPAINDPAPLCSLLSRVQKKPYEPLSKDQWESYRQGLHVSTKMGLETTKD